MTFFDLIEIIKEDYYFFDMIEIIKEDVKHCKLRTWRAESRDYFHWKSR